MAQIHTHTLYRIFQNIVADVIYSKKLDEELKLYAGSCLIDLQDFLGKSTSIQAGKRHRAGNHVMTQWMDSQKVYAKIKRLEDKAKEDGCTEISIECADYTLGKLSLAREAVRHLVMRKEYYKK